MTPLGRQFGSVAVFCFFSPVAVYSAPRIGCVRDLPRLKTDVDSFLVHHLLLALLVYFYCCLRLLPPVASFRLSLACIILACVFQRSFVVAFTTLTLVCVLASSHRFTSAAWSAVHFTVR